MNAQTQPSQFSDTCLAEAYQRTTYAIGLARSLLAIDPLFTPMPRQDDLVEPRWKFRTRDLHVTWLSGLAALVEPLTREGAAIADILQSHGVEGELETLTVLLVSGEKLGQWKFASEAAIMEWSDDWGPRLTLLAEPQCVARVQLGSAS